MALEPTLTVAMRPRAQIPPSEATIRYLAAYGCTLVSIAAAQLIIENGMALALAIVTLLGLPLSLWLRSVGLKHGHYPVSRFFINSLVVTVSLCGALLLVLFRLPIAPPREMLRTILISQGMGESMGLLMQMFLIFAVVRCLAIINDKDAVQCAIPSFSVFLLLIVVHRGPEVVAYFLLWAVLVAVLFAVDQRTEARQGITGVVPSALPGQDVTLSARSLATVLGFSLLCAIALSYTISSRDPEHRGTLETWMIQMAGRMTAVMLNLPEVSVSAGPERQIDFSTGPALPSTTPLWQARAALAQTGETLRPFYWRMFTLSDYNGVTWSQTTGIGQAVPRRPVLRRGPRDDGPRGDGPRDDGPRGDGPRGDAPRGDAPREPSPPGDGYPQRREGMRHYFYDIARDVSDWERREANVGPTRATVFQELRPLISMTGYVPTLPIVDLAQLPTSSPDQIRVRRDGAVDVQVLQGSRDLVRLRSQVPDDASYGIGNGSPPLKLSERPNPAARLTPLQRQRALQIYDEVKLSRVRGLARRVLARAEADESNYAKARRLAVELQDGAVYTLRPPVLPEGRDAADFFLFEGRRRGYCTYFAGALAMMCRTVGIPARVVSGFAGGDWDEDKIVLRESNSHAWTEVWVPDYGWAVVDATPADDRGQNAPSWYANWAEVFSAGLEVSRHWIATRILPVTAGLVVLIGFCFLALAQRRGLIVWPPHFGFRRATVSDDAARRIILDAYAHAARQMTRRFRRRAAWETPFEWAQAAQSTLSLQNAAPLQRLTQLYMRARYSTDTLGAKECEAASAALRALDWQRRP